MCVMLPKGAVGSKVGNKRSVGKAHHPLPRVFAPCLAPIKGTLICVEETLDL